MAVKKSGPDKDNENYQLSVHGLYTHVHVTLGVVLIISWPDDTRMFKFIFIAFLKPRKWLLDV